MEQIQQMKYQRKYNISRTAADVLIVIIDCMKASRNTAHKDAFGYYVYAGRKTIAKEIGKSVSTVNRAVKELIKAGLLLVRKGIRNSHTYFAEKLINAINGNNSKCSENDISPDIKMTSRIKGISINKTIVNNLSISKDKNTMPISTDDYKCRQRLQEAEKEDKRKSEAEEREKINCDRKREEYKEQFSTWTDTIEDETYAKIIPAFIDYIIRRFIHEERIKIGDGINYDYILSHEVSEKLLNNCSAEDVMESIEIADHNVIHKKDKNGKPTKAFYNFMLSTLYNGV